MKYNAISTIERFEFDPAIRTTSAVSVHVPSPSVIDVTALLGRLAVATTVSVDRDSTTRPLYLRGRHRLSADDVRQLEEYFAFLRSHYGIPEDVSIFPKKEAAETPVSPKGANGEA
ncbi:MAG: hypothetical protein ACRD6W_12860 [Nitrososphaerales archaeon]